MITAAAHRKTSSGASLPWNPSIHNLGRVGQSRREGDSIPVYGIESTYYDYYYVLLLLLLLQVLLLLLLLLLLPLLLAGLDITTNILLPETDLITRTWWQMMCMHYNQTSRKGSSTMPMPEKSWKSKWGSNNDQCLLRYLEAAKVCIIANICHNVCSFVGTIIPGTSMHSIFGRLHS